MVVGDILLKDALVCHRGHYLSYLKDPHVLPQETPIFDLKIRHHDPVGNRVPILCVQCGVYVSMKVAEILSIYLCGDGMYPEIFISRVGIGANKTSVAEYAQIYNKHIEFLNDITYVPFPVHGSIDAPVTKYLDTGNTILQSPQLWAKQLTTRPQLRCLRAYHLCRRRLPRARFVVRSRGNSLIYLLRRYNITKWPQKTFKHPKPSTMLNRTPSLSPTWKFPGIPALKIRPRSPPSHPLGLAGLVCLAHRPNLRTDLS